MHFQTLAEMVSRHMITIDQRAPSSSAGVQPPSSGGGGTSIGGDRTTSHVPHVCTLCGGPCYGLGPRHGTTTMTGDQVRTLLNIYYCSIFYFSIMYVTY